jgi:gamma-glutamylcyclotransferase (GGCT)/AIG2-like uncharacterized protein YtfP
MKEYLFVYGTLANENVPEEIASTVRRLKYVGDGFIFGRLYDLGEYPGAVLDGDRRNKVFGKIFELPDDREVLECLDAYEAFDPQQPSKSLFVRRRTTISRPKQPPLMGWMYEYRGNVGALPLIEDGQYSSAST